MAQVEEDRGAPAVDVAPELVLGGAAEVALHGVRRSNQAYAAAGPVVGCRAVRTSDTSWSSRCGRVVPWTATETATRSETESRTASRRSVT